MQREGAIPGKVLVVPAGGSALKTQTRSVVWIVLALIAAMTAVRLVVASLLPLGDDEAFYWLWAQHPAPCYYDHPGVVAWLVGLSTSILGTSSLAVRLPTILIGAVSAWLVFAIGWRLFNPTAGLYAALLFVLAPLFALGGILVASDAPLGLFWLLTMALAAEALIWGRRWLWLPAGAALGLAMLSKFTGVLLAPSLLMLLATSKKGRREFASPLIYLAALIAFIVFLPVFLWNLNNDWASLTFNAAGRHTGAHLRFDYLVQLLGAELAFLSPLVFIALAATLVKLIRLRGSNPRYRLLLWFAVPALAVFWGASFITRILPHWPAAGYLALIIGTGGLWAGVAGRKAERSWIASALGVAGVMTLLVFYVQPFYRLIPLSPGDDNSNHLYGWDQVTPVVRKELEQLGGEQDAFLCADRYQFGAQLAYNLRMPYRTFSLNPRRDQFDFWIQPAEVLGDDAVLVWEEDWGLNEEVPAAFERTEEVAVIPVYRQNVKVRTFHVVRCYNLQRIP